MMQNAKRSVLLADSSKLGIVSFVHFADLNNIDCFLTDDNAAEEDLRAFRQAGVQTEVILSN